MSKYPSLKLMKGKELAILRQHPWIFSGALSPLNEQLKEGSWVNMVDHKEQFLAFGYTLAGSITIKAVSFTPVEDHKELLSQRIKNAIAYRKSMGLMDLKDTNCYRLVFAEGDNLPGLIIDYYNGTAVIQCHAWAMYDEVEHICKVLKEVLGSKLTAVFNKSKETLHTDEIENGYLYKHGEPNEVSTEYGNDFIIDWEGGQKTGFFIDQRENRRILGEYAKGRKVLNAFCYTGGFSVYALNQGAKLVHSVDSSARAMEITERNIAATKHLKKHKGYKTDIFDFFKDCSDKYDMIVLDPPAFAKSKKVTHNAIQAYKRINVKAMDIIEDGGLLFTFSCSQNISSELFANTIRAAAIECGKPIRIIKELVQPLDHPMNAYHPEGKYLKGLVLMVG